MSTISTPASQVLISLIPIVGITISGIMVFFSLLWKHHEVKLQIKMGTYKKTEFNYMACSLLIGLLLTAIGIVLSLFFILFSGFSPAVLGGLIPLAVGISFIIFYKLYK